MADRRGRAGDLFAGEGGLGAQARETIESRRRAVAGTGQPTGVSGDSKEDDWEKSEGAHLRLGTAQRGDSALFHDAGNSSAAGLWADGDDRDLHHGSSEPG